MHALYTVIPLCHNDKGSKSVCAQVSIVAFSSVRTLAVEC